MASCGVQVEENKSVETLKDDLYVTRINNKDEFVNVNEGIVYFGRENCPLCKFFLPVLNEIIQSEHIEIFYFDTQYFRENSLLTEDELQQIFDEYQVIHVPIIIKIKNGLVEDTFSPEFNEQRDNVSDVKEETIFFLSRK